MKTNEGIFIFYQTELAKLQQEQQKLRSAAASIGWLRLFVFLLMAGFIWTGLSFYNYLFLGAAAALITFLFLIKIHLQKQFERELGEQKIKIIENEISCLNYEPGLWKNGEEFHNPNTYSFDLDLFGKYSLYHFVNRSATTGGQKELAQHLLHPKTDSNRILADQQAVQEMAHKFKFRSEWQGLALLLPDKGELKKNLQDNLSFKSEFLHSIAIKILLIFGPVSAFACTAVYYFTDLYQPLLYSIVINLMITGFFLKKVNDRQKSVDGLQKMMTAYSRMIICFKNENWDSSLLQKHASEISDAQKAFADLANISEWFDRRMNVVAGVLFNGYTLYDLHCVIRLERWKEANAHKCQEWFDLISSIEKYQSLGTFAFNHPEFSYPKTTDAPKIEALAIAHPLIPVEKNIPNDFSSSHPERIILITGSNMSGKSTFLRTIGVNLILAQSGLPVNAKNMEFSPMEIQTSLRQTDNLHENVSLFHAELLRLKSIRNHLKKGKLTLVLLDEMLRGTNSEDKLVGSRQLIEELLDENIFGLIASHDLELGKLEDKYPGKLRNACFESVIKDNELIFDYKLKTGIARNKNATFLLNKMDIIHSSSEIKMN